MSLNLLNLHLAILQLLVQAQDIWGLVWAPEWNGFVSFLRISYCPACKWGNSAELHQGNAHSWGRTHRIPAVVHSEAISRGVPKHLALGVWACGNSFLYSLLGSHCDQNFWGDTGGFGRKSKVLPCILISFWNKELGKPLSVRDKLVFVKLSVISRHQKDKGNLTQSIGFCFNFLLIQACPGRLFILSVWTLPLDFDRTKWKILVSLKAKPASHSCEFGQNNLFQKLLWAHERKKIWILTCKWELLVLVYLLYLFIYYFFVHFAHEKADETSLEAKNWTLSYWPTYNIPWQFLNLSILVMFGNEENPALLLSGCEISLSIYIDFINKLI